MSMPGWYPDPAGQPDRFRYWDGRRWSEVTTDNPHVPPPPPPGPVGPVGPPSRGRRRTLVALVVAALALLLVGGGVAGHLLTREGGEEQSARTSPSTDEALSACPPGNPATPNILREGRVVGGGLSFVPPRGYRPSVQNKLGFTWLSGVSAVERTTEAYPEQDYGWVSMLVAGSVAKDDGYTSPEQAARSLAACLAGSPTMYRSHESDEQVGSEAVEVDGHDAWEVRHEVRIDDDVVQTEGDHIVVVVVDLGADEDRYAVFTGLVPLDDEQLREGLDRAVETLRVP